MKRLLPIAVVVLAAASCTKSNTLTINGSVADSTLNSQTVYLSDYNSGNNIDSCVVTNGVFTLKGNTDSVAIVRVNLGRMYANVLAENGVVNVELARPSVVSGAPLNDLLSAFNAKIDEVVKVVRPQMQALFADSTLTDEEKEAKYDVLNNQYKAESGVIMDASIKGHETDPLGLYIIWDKFQGSDLSLAQMDSLITVGGKLAADFKPFQKMRQSAVNKEATAEGKMFVDFAGLNPDGTAAKLSDYVGKGKYVLVDFWASWCGPCKAEVPVIKEVYEAYKDKGLVVLGANVWDKKDTFEKAVIELEMPWAQICNFDNQTPTDLYGINGIPHIILFAPDGTIEARDLRGDAMKKKVASVIK